MFYKDSDRPWLRMLNDLCDRVDRLEKKAAETGKSEDPFAPRFKDGDKLVLALLSASQSWSWDGTSCDAAVWENGHIGPNGTREEAETIIRRRKIEHRLRCVKPDGVMWGEFIAGLNMAIKDHVLGIYETPSVFYCRGRMNVNSAIQIIKGVGETELRWYLSER